MRINWSLAKRRFSLGSTISRCSSTIPITSLISAKRTRFWRESHLYSETGWLSCHWFYLIWLLLSNYPCNPIHLKCLLHFCHIWMGPLQIQTSIWPGCRSTQWVKICPISSSQFWLLHWFNSITFSKKTKNIKVWRSSRGSISNKCSSHS